MRRATPPFALAALCLLIAGCATTTGAEGRSADPTASSTPSATPPSRPTPSAMPLPQVVMPTTPPAPEVQPAPPAEEVSAPPAPTRGPDEVDPADYVSYGIDTVNGGTPLTGVSFQTDGGRTICGIFSSGHPPTPAGAVSCTVDTYREIFPQPFPDAGPYVQSVMADPVTGSYGLYPDWFAQPTRAIPVLPDGKTMRYEDTWCSVSAETVTCTVSTGKGFTLSPTAYTLF